MIRDITIGQFYNVDSLIHRLDPRVKIMITLVYVLMLFVSKNPIAYLIAFLALTCYTILSKVPLRFMVKGLKTIWIFIAFSVVVHLFTVSGVKVWFEWKFIRITQAGVVSAIYMALRLVFMIIGSSMMTYTTTPNALADGLETMLAWMNKLRVPVHEFAMIVSIALRFIPILVEELNIIMKAQTARGIDFEEGNLLERGRKLMPVIVPLFVSAIKRSNDLALAMDARCYHGGVGRTKMKPLQYRMVDYIAYMLLFVYLVGMIVLAVRL